MTSMDPLVPPKLETIVNVAFKKAADRMPGCTISNKFAVVHLDEDTGLLHLESGDDTASPSSELAGTVP
ncbi:hypothetical protein Q7C36_003192 [Tachysurus vachellii]|uniref:Uncharacterized protein n=1 Tax=Tachysurus vachellii TaxID=175792 RepID=A0AA88NSE5_TACVA|nr:hypothetical protein Q7C36_003192 [Tachysurus vachellii]